MNIPIKGFIENSLVEWEGKIVSIIFLPLCNLVCHYCHAPHLVQTPNKLESIPLEGIIKKLRQARGWIDGVVVTGGEPTLQKELAGLLKMLKDTGILVRLDTNGTNPSVLEELINKELVDGVAMDIKAPFRREKYEQVAGTTCNIENLAESMNIIMGCGLEYEFRTTACPTQLDKNDIEEIAMSIQGAERYVIQNFRPNHCLNPEMLTVTPYSPEILKEFVNIARKYVQYCFVRGEEEMFLSRTW